MKLLTPKNNEGAILIISIIIGVIALAAGLTAANFVTRSTRNITDQESSIKALAISESGVEKVLGASTINTYTTKCLLTTTTRDNESAIPNLGAPFVSSGAIPLTLAGVKSSLPDCFFQEKLSTEVDAPYVQSYYLEVSSKGGKDTYIMDSLEKDTVLEISTKDMTGNITVSWNGSTSTNYASILVTEIYKDGLDYKVKKYAYNPSSKSNSEQGSNALPGVTSLNGAIVSTSAILLSTGTEIIRIKPLYFDAKDVVITASSGTFPSNGQGFDIYSTGCTCANVLDPESRKNSSVRKVKVTKTREHLPAIFDFVLYSGSETVPLTK